MRNRGGDDAVDLPFPQLADLSGGQIAAALDRYERERRQRPRSVLDGVVELARPVTFSELKIPLGELVQRVARATGVSLTAAREVTDEPVAVVVADRLEAAQYAASLVHVAYDEMPAHVDFAGEQDRAEAASQSLGMPTLTGRKGDAQVALAAAPHRLAIHLRNQRCAAVPMEPTVCIADWQSGSLTLYATTQTPHHQRNELAQMLGLAQQVWWIQNYLIVSHLDGPIYFP